MSPSNGPPRPVILIIDDDQTILRALRVAMSHRFDVETCSSPTRGVDLVKTVRPQVVILDVKMPERDGFWVFREIRKFDRLPRRLQPRRRDSWASALWLPS